MSSDFGPLKWKLADESQNRVFEVMEAEVMFFTRVRAMSLSRNLVKNQTVMKKYWPLPLIASRARGFYANLTI